MKKIYALSLPLALSAVAENGEIKAQSHDASRPNVLLIIADDLGKGDVSAYGSKSISTPNIDAIAGNGILFENGYATSATSTPSRYGLFTGMYPFRNPDAVILPGDAPLIIESEQPTMPKMFRQAGYATAAVGKWHLGMGNGNPDWNRQLTPCANDVGFDYTCVVAATNDRVPTVYVQNGLVENLDPDDPIEFSYDHPFPGEATALEHPEMLRMNWHHGHNMGIVNGVPRIGYMKGGKAARWVDEEMGQYFLDKCRNWLDTLEDGKPFFLYYGLHQPHVPRCPDERFAGKSGLGARGDVILEADWCVGEMLSYLEKKGLMENTIIIFTSDNGAVMQDGYHDGATDYFYVHDPHGGMRGGKYSLFDGGAHVPLMLRWDGHVKPQVSENLFSQLDFYASFAELLGAVLPAGLDSRSELDVLLGRGGKGREELILEAKMRLCYRKGNYVLIPPYKGKKIDKTGNEIGNFEEYMLYDLSRDPHQDHDIKAERPALFRRMKERFHELVGDYYSYNPRYRNLTKEAKSK